MLGRSKLLTKVARLFELQVVHHVVARERVGGGGERDARHPGKALVQRGQPAVFGPEVVPPLAHAMGFVDGKQAELAALVQRLQQRHEARGGEPLGRGVDQRQLAAQQLALHLGRLFAAEAGIQVGRGHTGFVQRPDLVVHQRNQGRDDHRHALPRAVAHDGRNLVTQRLAAARGHEHQRIAPAATWATMSACGPRKRS
jgi:hypothetical protein